MAVEGVKKSFKVTSRPATSDGIRRHGQRVEPFGTTKSKSKDKKAAVTQRVKFDPVEQMVGLDLESIRAQNAKKMAAKGTSAKGKAAKLVSKLFGVRKA